MSAPPAILFQLVQVMAVAVAVVGGLRRMRVPPLVGFLLTGVIVGPSGLNLVEHRHDIELLSEIGVVFLLFSIGLEFSLAELARMRALVIGAGGLQVVCTVAVTAGLGVALGFPAQQAVFLGFLLAMSSTAIVLKLLAERGETSALHGRLMTAVLLFQDLAVVPCMLLVPLLGGQGTSLGAAVKAVAVSVGVVLLILAAARWVFPFVLEHVVRIRTREVFTLTVFLVALGTSWLAGKAGLSLALGAFLAGLVLSESDYAHQIATEIAPLRDALSSLFFVSVGMLVQPTLLTGMAGVETLGLVVLVIALKLLVLVPVALGFGFGTRAAVITGLGLAQIGEFSFIMAQVGVSLGLLDPTGYERFIGVSVATMALTPVFLAMSQALSDRAQRIAWLDRTIGPGPAGQSGGFAPPRSTATVRHDGVSGRLAVAGSGPGAAGGNEPEVEGGGAAAPAVAEAEASHGAVSSLEDHVIVVGYGVNGRNVARALRQLEVRYVVLELNPFSVRTLREEGELAIYGDSTREGVLLHAGLARARVLVVAVSDPVSSRQTVAVARALNPKLEIIVRTRFVTDAPELARRGANQVVAEEFETSLELCSVVMAAYGATERIVAREREALRVAHDDELHGRTRPRRRPVSLNALMASADFEETTLDPASPAVGRSLRELELRGRTGASVIAVSRDGQVTGNPGGEFVLQGDDGLFLFGTAAQNEAARAVLAPPVPEGALPAPGG